MNAFSEVTLEELCRKVTDGTHDSPKLLASGVPFVKGKHISGGFLDLKNCDRISYEDHLKVISRSKPEKGDTLFSNIGSVGDSVFVNTDKEFSIKNLALFKPDLNKVMPKYLFYLLRSPVVLEGLLSQRSGSAQPFIGLSTLRQYKVRYHNDLTTQSQIVSIFSAYDDLIENNTRRIEILEEMARRLYEEWFVHFRFPGHEEVSFKESELGRIPEGWEVSPFTDLADVLSGGTPKKSEDLFWGGVIPFYTPKDAPRAAYALETATFITEAGLSKCSSHLYPKNTVFITARGTVGKVALASRDMAMNQSCYALKARDGFGQLFIFLALRNAVDELKAKSHGAVFDTIIKDTFKLLKVVAPDGAVASCFEESVKPIFGLILNLQKKNSNLRTQRDLLLPKLVSGEIDVSDIPMPDDKEVESA